MKKNAEFKINNFDLLRLIAACEVVADHYFQHLKIPISAFNLKLLYLFPGVPVFFIISGYLISASYERNNNLGDYFRNRALRIFPGLWTCILVAVVAISITGVSFFHKQTLVWLPTQFAGIIYTPDFLKNYGFGSYNGSLWTIPIELQFYILLPVCYKLLPKNKLTLFLCALFIVFTGVSFWCGEVAAHSQYRNLLWHTFIPSFHLFLLGVVLQRLRIYKSKWIHGKGFYWLIFYVAINLGLTDVLDSPTFLIVYSTVLAFCLVSMAYTLPDLSKKLLRSNDISYGIYIYHGIVLGVIAQEGLVGNINIYEVYILAIILAGFSWIFVEKPFIKMKKKTIRDGLESTETTNNKGFHNTAIGRKISFSFARNRTTIKS
jgi:peptidoglycan/LPS O-acetylase OafA/YrhL